MLCEFILDPADCPTKFERLVLTAQTAQLTKHCIVGTTGHKTPSCKLIQSKSHGGTAKITAIRGR